MGSVTKKRLRMQVGFTLIEVLIVIGIIAILAAVVIVAINPARQFAEARESQRISNVNAILNAIGENIADNNGQFSCEDQMAQGAGPLEMVSDGTGVDIYNCIVPTYMPELPYDPGNLVALNQRVPYFTNSSKYDTGYTVEEDSVGRFTVCAPGGVESAIPGSKAICVTR